MLFVVLLTAALSSPSHAVIGGEQLDEGTLPQVGMLRSDIYPHLCSAVLIGPRVIATAAHCAKASDQEFGPIEGAFYRVEFSVDPAYTGVNSPNIPEDFAVAHDIAIGTLAQEARISGVEVDSEEPREGESVVIAGTGEPIRQFRQFGRMTVKTVGPLGITLDGAATRQAGDRGDSGGGTFSIRADGTVALIGVNSTSTGSDDMRTRFKWPHAGAYTTGVARLLSREDSYLETFARRTRLGICGVNLSCPSVRAP